MDDVRTAVDDDLDPLDRIDKSIDIDASAERVFELISRPGWWINDGGAVDPAPDIRLEGDLAVVTHAEYGEFRLETVACEPPWHVAFRWHHRLLDDGEHRSTLVEFHLQATAGGGVRLRVVESGFSRLDKPRAEWLEDRADNSQGWDDELAAARTFTEGG